MVRLRQAGAFVRLVSAVRFGGPGQVAQEQACGAGGSGFGRGHGALGGVSRRFGTGFGDGGHYRRMAGLFLTWLESHGVVSLDGSDGSHVLGFLAGLRSRWSESSMRHAASDLRPLFRWLGRDDLADAIGLAGIRRTHAIAGTLPDDEHRRLLEACASRSVPSRDAAITLLSLTCGLRACDVIGLRIADVDWDSMSIGLVQRKTGNPLTVPMTGPLAARLASWLLDERPATDDDRVFVRYKAPHVALRGHSSVYEAISRVMRHAARTPGRFQAVAAQRGDEDAGGGHAVADDQRGAWPRRPRFHTRLHGHAPRGNARVRAAPCRKADRHETHGTRIRRPARRRIGGVHRFKASMGRAWRHPRPGPALVRPALPRTRGRASGAGRRGAMDRP